MLNAKLTRIGRHTDQLTKAESTLDSLQSRIRSVRAQVASIRDLAQSQLDAPGEDASERQVQLDELLAEINAQQHTSFQGGRPFLGRGDQSSAALGVNADQISNVQINSLNAESVELDGSLVREADYARIELVGAAGMIKSSADFDVTGSLGSHSFSVVEDELLVDVQQRVNLESGQTGVVASIENDHLVFRSANKGAGQQVKLEATNVVPTTVITGLNSQQVANVDASQWNENQVLDVSGEVVSLASKAQLTYFGDGSGRIAQNDVVTITGSLGSDVIVVQQNKNINTAVNAINQVQANTGVTARREGNQIILESALEGADQIVEVSSVLGSFEGEGGNGDGTANGTDYRADINGSEITANGLDQFVLQTGQGDLTFEFESAFVGQFDTFQISKVAHFELVGGNGQGEDFGVDGEATINGQSLFSASNEFVFNNDHANVAVTFQDGAVGEFDTITLDRDGGLPDPIRGVSVSIPYANGSKFIRLKSLSLDVDDLEGGDYSLNDLSVGGNADLAGDAQAALDTANAVLQFLDNHDSDLEQIRSQFIDDARSSLTNRTAKLQADLAIVDSAAEARATALNNRKTLRQASIASMVALLSGATTRPNAFSLLSSASFD